MKSHDERIHQDAKRTVAFIKEELLMQEPSLLLTKWPDYAFMSPLRATLKFVQEFNEAYKTILRREVDVSLSERSRGIDIGKALTDKKTLSAAWKAQQIADVFGLPYPQYLAFCMDFASLRQRRYFPYINQLGPVGDSEQAWLSKFEEHMADAENSGLPPDIRHDGYVASNFCGLPNQIATKQRHLDFLNSAVRPHHQAMRSLIDELQVLTADDCRKALGAEIFKSAFELVDCERRHDGIPVPRSPMPADSLRPSCFALQPREHATNNVCITCPLCEECRRVSEAVRADLAASGAKKRRDADKEANVRR